MLGRDRWIDGTYKGHWINNQTAHENIIICILYIYIYTYIYIYIYAICGEANAHLFDEEQSF